MLTLYNNRAFIVISPKERFIESIRRYVPDIEMDHIHSKRVYTFDDSSVESQEDLLKLLKENYQFIVSREIKFFVDYDIEFDRSFENFISCFSFEIVELGFDCSKSKIDLLPESEL